MTTLPDLEQRYESGVELLKREGYYQRVLEEVHYLVKYLDSQRVIQMFSDNLFSDIQGVFLIYVREDLKEIYAELKYTDDSQLPALFKRDSVNLKILHKCSTSLTYQVKSIIRMPQVKSLAFKSRYLETLSRKLSGEIQKYYRKLVESYKTYFRKTFSQDSGQPHTISLGCLRTLEEDYQNYFLAVTQSFPPLGGAISFTRELFVMELESRIREQISLFFQQPEKFEKLITYFINDLKRSLIQNLYRQMKQGRDYAWIRRGLEDFIRGERFGKLLRKVIFQTFSLIQKNNVAARNPVPSL